MPYRYAKRLHDSQYFHIFSRGNGKQTIFLSPLDYQRFIDRIRQYSLDEEISIAAYCLMGNHYHLLIQEHEIGAIAKFMQRVNVAYAMYFNSKYKRVGHLFQGPYGEKVINDDSYLLQASAYIHNNPRGIGKDPELYLWSSYKDYLSGCSSWVDKDMVLSQFPESNKVEVYRDFVQSRQDLVLADQERPGLEAVML